MSRLYNFGTFGTISDQGLVLGDQSKYDLDTRGLVL